MLHSPRRQKHIVGRVTDLSVMYMSLLCAYWVKEHFLPGSLRGLDPKTDFLSLTVLVSCIWLVMMEYMDVPIMSSRKSFVSNIKFLPSFLTVCFLVLSFFLYIFKIQGISRLYIGLFFIFNGLFMVLVRYAYFSKLSDFYPLHRLLFIVVGTRTAAEEVINHIREELREVEVLGCLDTDPECVGRCVQGGIKVIGTVNELDRILTTQVVDELVFVVPINLLRTLNEQIEIAETLGVTIRIIPHWNLRKYLEHKPQFYRLNFEMFGRLPSLLLSASPWNRAELAIKSVFDFLGALVLLVLLSPLMVFIGIAIKRASPGPVFYRQVRCGLYGRRFTLYKFRTMVVGAEEMLASVRDRNVANGPVFKALDDPRIIPGIGHFLRKTGLDELPQLINVVRGEMSLVGPRPPLPEEVEKYDLWQRRRLMMKPGITCLWQIQPDRHRMPFDQWMALDLQYIDHWSLWLDIKILLKTLAIPLLQQGSM